MKRVLNNMKAICIDNSNKPEGILDEEWLEEGMVYTIIDVVEMALQEGLLGLSLKEVKLTQQSAPYKYYSIERFLIVPEGSLVSLKATEETVKKEIKNMEIRAEDADLSSLA